MMNTCLPGLNLNLPQLAEHRAFWSYCAKRELRFQRCESCGTHRHPPAPLCAVCRSALASWTLAPDDAELFSYTVVHHAASPALEPVVPYNVAIVAFPSLGHLRMVSNVLHSAAEELNIGMALVLAWRRAEGSRQLPLFRKRRIQEAPA